MFTSHYEINRCFEETKDGSFQVLVHGDWLPRHVFGAFHILFATCRNLWLAFQVARRRVHYDVFIVDQVTFVLFMMCGRVRVDCLVSNNPRVNLSTQISACIPLLRLLCPKSKILFYCHFPDQLLVQNKGFVKKIYRIPFDLLEETTTGLAHHIVVNSNFTRGVFLRTFKLLSGFLHMDPSVMYPCIELGPDHDVAPRGPDDGTGKIIFLSINRYEKKKAVHLALQALQQLGNFVTPKQFSRVELVIAGGYDPRLAENVEVYEYLVRLSEVCVRMYLYCCKICDVLIQLWVRVYRSMCGSRLYLLVSLSNCSDNRIVLVFVAVVGSERPTSQQY